MINLKEIKMKIKLVVIVESRAELNSFFIISLFLYISQLP